jgi:hypothetical protein
MKSKDLSTSLIVKINGAFFATIRISARTSQHLRRTSELVKELLSHPGAFDCEYEKEMERGVESLKLMWQMPGSPKLLDCLVIMNAFDACCLAARHPALTDTDCTAVIKSLDLLSRVYPCLVALMTLPSLTVICPEGKEDLTVKPIYERLLISRRQNDMYFHIKMADAVTLLAYLAKTEPSGEVLRLVEELWVHTVSYRDALQALKDKTANKVSSSGEVS